MRRVRRVRRVRGVRRVRSVWVVTAQMRCGRGCGDDGGEEHRMSNVS